MGLYKLPPDILGLDGNVCFISSSVQEVALVLSTRSCESSRSTVPTVSTQRRPLYAISPVYKLHYPELGDPGWWMSTKTIAPSSRSPIARKYSIECPTVDKHSTTEARLRFSADTCKFDAPVYGKLGLSPHVAPYKHHDSFSLLNSRWTDAWLLNSYCCVIEHTCHLSCLTLTPPGMDNLATYLYKCN